MQIATGVCTDWNVMRTFVGFLFFAALAGGIIWYENQPTTVKIPVETTDQIAYHQEYQAPTTTEVAVTQPPHKEVDYSKPDLILQVRGVNGDDIDLKEKVSKPQHLDDLAEDVQAVLTSCPGVTDRDMVVRVDSRLDLISSLPAEVSVNYDTTGHAAVYNFSDGLTCQDGGGVNFKLTPNKHSQITYWVVLTGVITPDYPNGDYQAMSTTLTMPGLVLPNLQGRSSKVWGPRVMQCNDLLNGYAKIWLAGAKPADCTPADLESLAVSSG